MRITETKTEGLHNGITVNFLMTSADFCARFLRRQEFCARGLRRYFVEVKSCLQSKASTYVAYITSAPATSQGKVCACTSGAIFDSESDRVPNLRHLSSGWASS